MQHMRHTRDLLIGALISVLLHVGVGLSIAYTGILAPGALSPAMQKGKSGLAVTLLPSHLMLRTDQQDSELAIILTQPDSEIVKDRDPPEDTPEPSTTEQDADTLTKGVESAPRQASNFRIRYPLGPRLRKEEGTVVVRVTVDAAGRARSLAIVESSGYTGLDQQALKDLRRARYYPARDSDGSPCAGELIQPVEFKLTD